MSNPENYDILDIMEDLLEDFREMINKETSKDRKKRNESVESEQEETADQGYINQVSHYREFRCLTSQFTSGLVKMTA